MYLIDYLQFQQNDDVVHADKWGRGLGQSSGLRDGDDTIIRIGIQISA